MRGEGQSSRGRSGIATQRDETMRMGVGEGSCDGRGRDGRKAW